MGGLGGSLCVELCAGDWGWPGSSLPSILLKGLEEACACEPPGSADQRNPKGREYLIIMNITFRAEHLPRAGQGSKRFICMGHPCSQQSCEAGYDAHFSDKETEA